MDPTRITAAAAVAVLLGMLPPSAISHHGWSDYDGSRLLTVTGTIEESSYENPHGGVKLRAPDRSWTVVLAPPSRMERRGLTKDMLKPGAVATVEGYQHTRRPGELRAERIIISDKTVELR